MARVKALLFLIHSLLLSFATSVVPTLPPLQDTLPTSRAPILSPVPLSSIKHPSHDSPVPIPSLFSESSMISANSSLPYLPQKPVALVPPASALTFAGVAAKPAQATEKSLFNSSFSPKPSHPAPPAEVSVITAKPLPSLTAVTPSPIF